MLLAYTIERKFVKCQEILAVDLFCATVDKNGFDSKKTSKTSQFRGIGMIGVEPAWFYSQN